MKAGSRFPDWSSVPAAASLLAGGLLVAGLGVIYQNERSYQQQVVDETRVQAEILAASVTAALDFGDVQAAQETVNALRANREIQSAVVYDEGGGQFAGFERSGLPLPPLAAQPSTAGNGEIAATVGVMRDRERIGSVHLSIAREPLARKLTRYVLIGLFVVMAALLAAVLGAAHAALRGINRELEGRAAALAASNNELSVQIAERAKAEEQLRQAQKMQALGQLTGGIAHDFNNLLTVIQGSAEVLQRPDLSAEKRARFAAAISQTAARAATLTSQLLAFARRQPLRPETIDLNGKLRGMADLLDRTLGERVRVETELSTEICAVKADPTQLESAILNIAVNARDAMPEGGTLTIRTCAVSGDPPSVSVALTDTGSGMDADALDRVFEPFFTTKEIGKGTGLGLSQVYGFANQSGGEVSIRSSPGAGTTVTLLLPCSDDALDVEPIAAEERAPAACRACRVLVVDDNQEVGAFAEALLSEMGHRVVRATSGEHALQMFQPGAFDLVFTDVVMPGMGGLQLADELRKRAPTLPIILATGYSDQLTSSSAGDLPVLLKPYKPDVLAATFEKALRQAQ